MQVTSSQKRHPTPCSNTSPASSPPQRPDGTDRPRRGLDAGLHAGCRRVLVAAGSVRLERVRLPSVGSAAPRAGADPFEQDLEMGVPRPAGGDDGSDAWGADEVSPAQQVVSDGGTATSDAGQDRLADSEHDPDATTPGVLLGPQPA